MVKPTLWSWIQSQLNKENITQNEFARRSGVSSATLSQIRRGHVPTADTVRLLAEYTHTDVESLLEIAGIIQPLSDLPPDISPETRELVRRLKKLPEEDQAETLELWDKILTALETRVKVPNLRRAK